MTKKVNGASRDIEVILADIRSQAQQRAAAVDVETNLTGLAYAYDQKSQSKQDAIVNRLREPDLPAILLKGEEEPSTYQEKAAPEKSLQDDAPSKPTPSASALRSLRDSLANGGESFEKNADEEADRPVMSALKNARQGLSSLPSFKQDAQSTASARHDIAATKTSNDNDAQSKPNVADAELKLVSPSAPEPREEELTDAAQQVASPENQAAVDPNMPPPIRRQAPNFFDTRMSRMTSTAQQSGLEIVDTVRNVPAQAGFVSQASVPAATGNTQKAADATSGVSDQDSSVHQAAAELLRPMLKDWVGQNMPHIVEKALHLELADAAKKDKKS